jgi:GNAT superfamily N-acetyltransferase
LAILVREYDDNRDYDGLRGCFIELQDFEHALDARMPTGLAIQDDYLPQMFERCKDCDGIVLIAEMNGQIAGYATVLNRVSSDELADGSVEYGLVKDLLVRRDYRGRGVGRRLLAAAETFALAGGVRWLRIGALARNQVARALYESSGFSYLYVEFEKDLGEEA